jgi:hypothetical protein
MERTRKATRCAATKGKMDRLPTATNAGTTVEERTLQRRVKRLSETGFSPCGWFRRGYHERRPRELKPTSIGVVNAALEGPLFHGSAIGGCWSDHPREVPAPNTPPTNVTHEPPQPPAAPWKSGRFSPGGWFRRGYHERRPRGLKPRPSASVNAALEGPLFHGSAIGECWFGDPRKSPAPAPINDRSVAKRHDRYHVPEPPPAAPWKSGRFSAA